MRLAKQIFFLLTLVGIGAFASMLAAQQNPAYEPDPTWRVPPEASAKVNPLAGKPDAVAGGHKLFARECVSCHGANGRGEDTGAADLQLPIVQKQRDGALFWKISSGNTHRGMPAFSRLPELQRWQLVMYLRTLKSSSAQAGKTGAPTEAVDKADSTKSPQNKTAPPPEPDKKH
jgi:mono/diheme cytochrome c family protein